MVSLKVKLFKVVLGLVVLTTLHTVFAIGKNFEEGKHYTVIDRQPATEHDEESPGNGDESVGTTELVSEDLTPSVEVISVVEYFSYGCAHCYRLEPFIEAWLETKEEDVVFSRVAVPTRQDWIPLARAYYMAEVMGITNKVHSLMFRAVHVNKQAIGQQHLLKRMFVGVAEVDPAEFDTVLESDEIPGLIQEAALEMRDFGVSASPTIVVAETYVITPETAGDLGLMFEVVDFLVNKIKAERETEETATNEPAS